MTIKKHPKIRPIFLLLFSEEGLAINNDIAAVKDTSMIHPERSLDICFRPCGLRKKPSTVKSPSIAPVRTVEWASSAVWINGDAVTTNDDIWASSSAASHRLEKSAEVDIEDLGLGKAGIEASIEDGMDGGGNANRDSPIAK